MFMLLENECLEILESLRRRTGVRDFVRQSLSFVVFTLDLFFCGHAVTYCDIPEVVSTVLSALGLIFHGGMRNSPCKTGRMSPVAGPVTFP